MAGSRASMTFGAAWAGNVHKNRSAAAERVRLDDTVEFVLSSVRSCLAAQVPPQRHRQDRVHGCADGW
jgi:hypothetical protein